MAAKILPIVPEITAEYLRLTKADLADSQNRLDELPKEDRRGLTLETLRHFHCGFLPDWVNTKSRAELACGLYVNEYGKQKKLPPPSPRIIIPTLSGEHFNAVATSTSRPSTEKAYWKQHVGSMELFYDPEILTVANTVIVVEGEVDAMSIYQASQGKIAAVAILGCMNWKKTLLPKLEDLRGKRFIVMLDADVDGKKAAKKLATELLQSNFRAISKTLFDGMSHEERKTFDKKVDANSILTGINCGDSYLNNVLSKIIRDAENDFTELEEKIARQSKNPFGDGTEPDIPVIPIKKPAQSSEISEADGDIIRDKIRLILNNFVHARDLTRQKWFEVGCIMKRYGFEFADFDAWSRDDSRYNASKCKSEWNSYKTADELKGGGYTIKTLIDIAKEYGYSTKKNSADRRADSKPAAPMDERELEIFQEQYGEIDPKLLPKIRAAKTFIDGLNTMNFKPENAFDVDIWSKVSLLRFYMPSVSQKFFDVIKDVRKVAKDILKKIAVETDALKKANEPIPEIDDTAITRLSELAPSKIEDEISSNVVAIKRRHKNFLADLQAQKNEAARQATLDALAKNPFWTQNIISDCPLNLFVPETIFFSEKTIGTQNISENGTIQKRAAAKTPIIVSRILREPQKHTTQYEVQIKARHVWRKIICDGDELADTRKILRLARDGGAIIKDPRALANFFAEFISANEDRLNEIKTYDQPGWHGDKFIYPISADGDDYICRRAGFNYELEFATQGDNELWKKTFLDACDKGGALARMTFGNVFSAPLIRPFNVPNTQYQLDGKSGGGKTAILKFAASTFGNPRKLIRTFGATLKNRQAVAVAYCDLPTFLDELGTLQGGKKGEETLPQMIYDYEQGTANQAQKRNGEAREAFVFHGSRTMTGEFSILKSHAPRGTYKRVICLNCGEKLFGDEFATKLHVTAENNFGLFGRQWTKYVEENLEKIRKTYTLFTEVVYREKQPNVEATLLKSATVSAVAFQFFKIAIGGQETFDFVAAAKDIIEIISTLPTPDEIDDSTRAIKDLQSYIAGHDKYFIREIKNDYTDGVISVTPQPFESYGKKFDNGEIAFFPHALKKILEKDLGYQSTDALISEFARKGYLRCGKGKGNGYRISTRIDGKPQPTYRFKADVFSQNAEPEIDTESATEM